MKFRQILPLLLGYFLFYSPSSDIQSQIVSDDGFLGLDFTFGWHGGTSRSDKKEPKEVSNDVYDLSLRWIGLTAGAEITTEIQLSNDLIHIVDNFKGSSAYLKKGEINPFSYFEFSVQYLTKRFFQNFYVLAGIGLGHLGYISSHFNRNPYTFFLSPIVSLRWYVFKYIAISSQFDIPIGTYRRNATRLWHLRSRNEIIFSPTSVLNPNVDSSLPFVIGAGVQYEYVTLKTIDDEVSSVLNLIRPYFRFTYLY